ncbi:hypothetical protein ROLI_015040 [Roseobacter fucihabitans]|uniref:Diguanylate cyclase/phosphodiesterase n=2 Tax=Roseobacter fucihabitans TaxID=1537242 RepID=A0ABZ2BR00_9RHOB|nr:Cyclic di-GMP phosphodiesterase Gmr [Roseobacter litoralis]
MGVFERLGRLSDQLTGRLLRKHSAPGGTDLVKDRQGFVRKAQLTAVMATSLPMMMANICNALALVALQYSVDRLDVVTLVWAGLVTVFASFGIASARKFHTTPPRHVASVRAPGKIVFSSLLLALIWCFPLLFLVPGGNLLQVAFISALTAGMIAGGALALYPVPLAGSIYVTVLSVMAFVTIVVTGALPLLPFGLVIGSFALIVTFSTRRHTVLFLSEMIGRLEAERQRDMVNLLLDTYQGKGGQYLWRSDQNLTLTETPNSLFQMLGLPPGRDTSGNLITLLRAAKAVGHNAQSVAAFAAMTVLRYPTGTDFEMVLRLANKRFLKLAGRSEISDETAHLSYHGYLKDVTSEMQAIEKVYHLATCDTMTGLLNYREFSLRVQAELEALRDQEGDILFVFLDADNLKRINDSFGHAVGDRLIETIGQRFGELLPQGSLVARKGGDEFVALILPNQIADVAVWADGLLEDIGISYCCDGLEIPVSCCVGVSVATCAQAQLRRLELEADRALYSAKSRGKRQARIYKEKFGQQIQRDRVLALDLEAAMEGGELTLLFQPIVDARDGLILGAEALLRWEHSVYHDVTPEKIVSIAQCEGLGPKLFEYVLGHALSHAAHWSGTGFVAVNMHSADLQMMNCSTRILEALQQQGLPADRLWLEVTEAELLLENGPVQDNITALRAAGVRVVIDEFGVGNTSLSHLATSPSDIVKIDKNLIAHCDRNDSSRIIIQAMQSLAFLNGFQMVAVGVERAAQRDMLIAAGVRMAQGFAFHGPMLPSDLLAKLAMQQSFRLPAAS